MSNDKAGSVNSSSRQYGVFGGALFTVAMRWTDRLIGLISTLILARLLVPADFGIVAMASVIVGLIDVFLDLGVNLALIQNQNASKEDFDTAWTLRLIQSLIAGIIVVLAAPLAAFYFHDERVTDVLRVMAFSVFIGGMENIGIVTFQKNMEFGQDFRFFFLKRVVGFGATVGMALALRSYWALVLGSMANRTVGVALSYALHSYRPSFSLASFKSIWSFSQWMLVRNIGGYLNAKIDKLLVGRSENTAVMGAYTLADEISALPSAELLAPLNRVLLPVFARQQKDLCSLRESYLLSLAVQTMIGIPAGVGIALVAHEAILFLLGPKWLTAVPFVQILGLINVVSAISSSGGYVLLARGNVRNVSIYNWVQVLLFTTIAIVFMPNSSALTIAVIRAITVSAGLIVSIRFILAELRNVHPRDLFGATLRPMLSGSVMAFAVEAIGQYAVPQLTVGSVLAIKVVAGAIVYGICLAVLWCVAGKPSGAERYLLQKLGCY